MAENSQIVLIPTKLRSLFYRYLQFINPILQLTDTEMKVLGEVLYHYNEAAGTKEHIRWQYVFSTDTRKVMREELGINQNQFDTALSRMSKKEHPILKTPIILSDKGYKEIHKSLIIVPGKDKFELTFSLKIDES